MLVNKSDVMRKALLGSLFLYSFLFSAACKKKATGVAEAPLPATTTVSSPDLKMRISPNTTAAEIGRLTRGETVKIVQRSADSVQVGNLNAYWYKVTTASGLTGWVYGAHLAIEADESELKAASEESEKKLKAAVIGRWNISTIQGELTPDYVFVRPNGQIEFGTNRKGQQYGKYTIEIKDGIAHIIIADIKKPNMTDLKAKMIGSTLVFTGVMKDTEYKLTFAEESTDTVRDPSNKKAAEAQAPAAAGTP